MSDTPDPIDLQLIELLRQKSPEELTFEELDLLRTRLTESPALRNALADYLQTESYLTQVLGEFSVSPEQIIHKAEAQQRAVEARPWQWLLGILACLLMVGVVGAVFVNAIRPPAMKQPIAQGTSPADKKADVPPIDPAIATKPANEVNPSVETVTPNNDNTKPVKPLDKPPVKKLEVAFPATAFLRGNMKIDNSKFGNAANIVIHSDGNKQGSVEYDFVVPREGKFFLHLRYASAESRPLKGTLNYKKLDRDIAGGNSGGNLPTQQKWFTAGPFSFKKGINHLKLEREGPFPYLSRLVVSTEPTISDATAPPPGPGEIAAGSEPWDEALAQAPLPTAAFTEFDTTKWLPQVPDILRWFETIPGQQQYVGETGVLVNGMQLKCGEIEGVFRLRSPWKDNVALRLALEKHNRLKMHFYDGLEGVTLVYYQDEGYTWCAYQTTRKAAGTHKPETLALAGTDAGRAARTEVRFAGGPLDFRWHAGELLLSRGDVVLVRAPLKHPPQEVFFEGKVAFIGIGLVTLPDAPPPLAALPVTAEITKPADLPWFEKLSEKTKVIKHPDGSIELISDHSNDVGFISAPLNQKLPCEVLVELEGATSGSGVFLTGEKTDNISTVRFANNNRTQPPTLVTMLRRDEFREGDFGDYRERPTLHVGSPKQFVRLIGGAGVVRYAISGDGLHFAEWDALEGGLPPGINCLALDYTRGTPQCKIKLNRITIRTLPALAAQADMALLDKVPVLTNAKTPTIGQWLAEVTAAQPLGVDASAWRRTAALRALAQGCDAELGQRLLRMILDDADARGIPFEQQLALISEATLLLDTRNNQPLAQEYWKRYFDVAARAQQQAQLRPFSLVRKAAIDSPIWSRHNFPVADEKTIRLELIQLMNSGQWEETIKFCQLLRFFQAHQQVKLVEWAEIVAARQLPGRPTVESTIIRQKSSWRPLLVEELSKDAYNALAEMQAVLDSDAYDDAARMITSISPDAVAGVAPHGRDRQLLVALPSAIRLALRNYPQLQTVMNQKFGSLAQLRVKQSINANNVAAVELAAVQFEATEAASEAHRWLGDRALSSGWFARALAEYDRATRTATTGARHDLDARMRLAAAMQGSDLGQPVTRPVVLGEMTISPAEFEAMVADMRQANAAAGGQRVVGSDQRVFPAPKLQGYELQQRPDPGGHGGESPNDEITRDIRNLKINWCERQLASVVEGNVLYVSNRFHIGAFDLNNGQRMWIAETFPGNRLRARDWTLIPMRPLVTSKHIFARVMYGTGPMLVCLDKAAGGKLLWTSEQRNNEFVVSDPLLIQDQLVALTMTRGDQGQGVLRLTTYDRDSGEPLLQRNLLRVNDVWWTRRACEVTALDDAVLANLGGISVCCDLSGNVRWIRKELSLPPEEESSWVKQYFERPLVIGGQAYLTQPSVRSLECVDIDTGRLAWSRVIPDIESLVGQVDGKLIVRTELAFLALNAADGKTLWRHDRPEVFDAVALGGPHGFVYAQKQTAKDKTDRFFPRLVWVDLNTGIAQGSLALPQLENNEPHFGPLVTYNDRIWAWYHNGNDQTARQLWELIPKGDVAITPPQLALRSPWSSGLDPALRGASERLLPSFTLLAGTVNAESGYRDEAYGERDVLGVCLRPTQSILFARDLAASDKSPGKLQMRFNYRGDNLAGKMSVQFGGETLWTQQFDQTTQPQQWKDLEVDLAKCAGKAGTLQVRMDFASPQGEMSTFWKKLEIAP